MAGGNSAARAPGPAEPGNPVAAGALPSFASIYRLHFDFVWTSARRLGVGPESIDDVVQEIFVIIHARLHTLQQPESLRSWIYGVVRRTVSGYHRSRRAKDPAGMGFGLALFDEAREASQLSPLEHTEQNDQLRLLAKLLSQLDELKREVFVLAELEEMTAPEIAEALEIPLNTAYSRLRAARQAFEEALNRHAAREKGGRQRD